MRQTALALALLLASALLASALLASAPSAQAQQVEVEAAPEAATSAEQDSEEIWQTWWFWLAITNVVLGVTVAIVVDATTDDPAPSDPMDTGMTGMGLSAFQLRF